MEVINFDELDEARAVVDLENLLDKAAKGKLSTSDHQFSHADLVYLTKLLQEMKVRKEQGEEGCKWFKPGTLFGIENCPKHYEFFKQGKEYTWRLFLSGNRTGKTQSGSVETSLHLTGLYPEWWPGKVFEEPTNGLACGKTGQTVRDTVQLALLGPPGKFGTGDIPKSKIIRVYMRPGVPNAVDTVVVKHVSGGESTLNFKSYDQRIDSFVGTARNFIWQDEEPPAEVHNENHVRLMTTNGIGYTTLTPISGITPFIYNYCKDADYTEGSRRLVISEALTNEMEKSNDEE